jgi:protein-L-isoaspartate(D-aspartate) O-methyltransferase
MIELAAVTPTSRVLDVGTGSGYAAAVLAEIAEEVVTVEIREDLAETAKKTLVELGYDNIDCRHGNAATLELGHFDAILVAAATRESPPGLESQLTDGGRLVIPLGRRASQRLWVIERSGDELLRRPHESVAFVPLL